MGKVAVAQVSEKMSKRKYFGEVKVWNQEKGHGHIKCHNASDYYGKDVFLLSGRLNGAEVEVGTCVTFSVIMTPKGPQAQDVKVIPSGSYSTETGADVAGLVSYEGTLKSFNEHKGWGFLESEALRE